MERTTLLKWLAGIAIAVFLGFVAGRQQQLLRNDREILEQIREIKTTLAVNAGRASAPADSVGAPENLMLKTEGAATHGNAKARITVIEFSDFECPFCGRYARDTYPSVNRDFVETGKVRYVFRNFPLTPQHPHAMMAGEAGECANRQNKFWPLHGLLFANQRSLDPASLTGHAQKAGLDMKAFSACLEGQAAETVSADLEMGAKAGVTATPTFMFGFTQPDGSVQVVERLLGTKPYSTFKSVLERLLATQ